MTKRIETKRAEDPSAEISINLTGFSRGAAQANALANLIDERGIPDYCAPRDCVIDTMVGFDGVDQTHGALDSSPPDNVRNTLRFVALDEGRPIMPAMPFGPGDQVRAVPEPMSGRCRRTRTDASQ